MADDITASVPAAPEHVVVLRTVAASVAAQLGFSLDEIDDLRLAVDEAAAHLLSAGGGRTTLSLRLTASGTTLAARLVVDGTGVAWGSDDGPTLSWQILSALVEDLAEGVDDAGSFVTFAKRGKRP